MGNDRVDADFAPALSFENQRQPACGDILRHHERRQHRETEAFQSGAMKHCAVACLEIAPSGDAQGAVLSAEAPLGVPWHKRVVQTVVPKEVGRRYRFAFSREVSR